MSTTSQEFLYENKVYQLVDTPFNISVNGDDDMYLDFHFLQLEESLRQSPKGPDVTPAKFHVKTHHKNRQELVNKLRGLAEKIENGSINDKEDGLFTW